MILDMMSLDLCFIFHTAQPVFHAPGPPCLDGHDFNDSAIKPTVCWRWLPTGDGFSSFRLAIHSTVSFFRTCQVRVDFIRAVCSSSSSSSSSSLPPPPRQFSSPSVSLFAKLLANFTSSASQRSAGPQPPEFDRSENRWPSTSRARAQ